MRCSRYSREHSLTPESRIPRHRSYRLPSLVISMYFELFWKLLNQEIHRRVHWWNVSAAVRMMSKRTMDLVTSTGVSVPWLKDVEIFYRHKKVQQYLRGKLVQDSRIQQNENHILALVDYLVFFKKFNPNFCMPWQRLMLYLSKYRKVKTSKVHLSSSVLMNHWKYWFLDFYKSVN